MTYKIPFHEIAYFILCLAAGGGNLALVDEGRLSKRDGYAEIRMGNNPESEIELVSSLGAG